MPLIERRVLCVVALAAAATFGTAAFGLAQAAQAAHAAHATQAAHAAQAAQASIGVGVQANPVQLTAAVRPGGSYPLPSLYVVNTGTEAETISVEVKRMSSGPGQTIPAAWIRVGDSGEQLQPRQQALIPLQLNTPASAKPGRYRSDLVVTGSGAATGAIHFGAAAATELEFSVVPGPAPGGFLGLALWKWWLIGILAVFGLAVYGIRHLGLRIRIETNSFGGPRA